MLMNDPTSHVFGTGQWDSRVLFVKAFVLIDNERTHSVGKYVGSKPLNGYETAARTQGRGMAI